jgi:hypothetical protein
MVSMQRLLLRPDSTHENARGGVPPASTNIRMTIPKNLESSGTLVHYIVPMIVVGLTPSTDPRRCGFHHPRGSSDVLASISAFKPVAQ